MENAMASFHKMTHGPADRSRINVNEPLEVRYWCRELHVEPRDLRRVIQRVGPLVADVKEEFLRMGAHGLMGQADPSLEDAAERSN
jgi:hypothetical protein